MKKLVYAILLGLGITCLASNRGHNSNSFRELKNEPFHTKVAIPKDGTIVANIPCKTPNVYQPKHQVNGMKLFAQNIRPVISDTLRLYK